MDKKDVMKRIVYVAFSSSFDGDKMEEIIEKGVIEKNGGEIREELTADGFKVCFKDDEGEEIFFGLFEPLNYQGHIFYNIKSDCMSQFTGLCGLEKEAKDLYNLIVNRLLAE